MTDWQRDTSHTTAATSYRYLPPHQNTGFNDVTRMWHTPSTKSTYSWPDANERNTEACTTIICHWKQFIYSSTALDWRKRAVNLNSIRPARDDRSFTASLSTALSWVIRVCAQGNIIALRAIESVIVYSIHARKCRMTSLFKYGNAHHNVWFCLRTSI